MTADPRPQVDSHGSSARYDGLLVQVMSNTLDEDYSTVARQRAADGKPKASPGTAGRVGLVLALFGLLIGIATLSTQQDQPRLEAEREELIDQIQAREDRLDGLQAQIAALDDEITVLQENVADDVASSTALQRRLDLLGVGAGTIDVEGPGVVITVDDAPGADADSGGVVRDQDLQALVNGLWAAGAEAVAVDGFRLTSLTAIRFAGQAITVDYHSLRPPYVVEAIGDPDTLPAELAQTEGGQLWISLQANFGIRYDYETRESIDVPGDPHEHLYYADRPRR